MTSLFPCNQLTANQLHLPKPGWCGMVRRAEAVGKATVHVRCGLPPPTQHPTPPGRRQCSDGARRDTRGPRGRPLVPPPLAQTPVAQFKRTVPADRWWCYCYVRERERERDAASLTSQLVQKPHTCRMFNTAVLHVLTSHVSAHHLAHTSSYMFSLYTHISLISCYFWVPHCFYSLNKKKFRKWAIQG